jgi:FlaA1/EpsC-like NDP-sugar epimerase
MTLGKYSPISDSHMFDMEYWSLQQKKLGRTSPALLQGQIAVITGGGGAIGLGVADRLLAAGAVVVLSDIDEPEWKVFAMPRSMGQQLDVLSSMDRRHVR